jgi:hypothetical protein
MRSAPCIAVLLLTASCCAAQTTTTDPTLHKRGTTSTQSTTTQSQQADPGTPKQSGSWSSLPDDAQGEYQLDETGSVVQITIEDGKLSGYVTKVLDEETGLTYFFERAAIHGNQVSFATKEVHGISYSFEGQIVRGDSRANTESGFYRLKGAWTLHDNTHKTQSESNVSLKSTPRSGETP